MNFGRFLRIGCVTALTLVAAATSGAAYDGEGAQNTTTPPARQQKSEQDPFGNLKVEEKLPDLAPAPEEEPGWFRRLTRENFQFKTELYSQFTYGYKTEESRDLYSRQSVGLEVLKRFSTKTATVASFNAQLRLTRRDNFIPVQNDMEGADREDFYLEYHNLYFDFYNAFNPFMGQSARSSNVGRFNLRIGRFYLPFGLNLQSDTHGTLFQLSNDRNFGFERDWYAGFWGSLGRHVNYDLYYMLGSGYGMDFDGQSGLLAGRLSLGNRYLNERGLEGGISVMAGERVSAHSAMRSPSVMERAHDTGIIKTFRFGLDGRYTRMVPGGTLTLANELSAGQDEPDRVFTNLHQAEYLDRSRRWGIGAQYRRFWQDIPDLDPMEAHASDRADAAVALEFTRFFRNDVGNARLHWIKFNVERQLERMDGKRDWLFTLQYYFYW